MLREFVVFILVLSLTVSSFANPNGQTRFSPSTLSAIGNEIATAQQRIEILNTLMQEDFEKKWLLQDVEAVATKAHYDYSLKARFGTDSIHSSNPYLKYQYIVARLAVDRAIDGLASWVMVNKSVSPNLIDILNKPAKTIAPVYASWLGKTIQELTPSKIIFERYPGLSDKLSKLGTVVFNADTNLHRKLMAESLLLPAVQLDLTKQAMQKLEEDRKRYEAETLNAAKVFDLAYKTKKEYLLIAFEKKVKEIKSKYKCSSNAITSKDAEAILSENATKDFLSAEDVSRLDQQDLTQEIESLQPCFSNDLVKIDYQADLKYLTTIRDEYIPKANQEITPARLEYEKAKANYNKNNEDIVKLHITYNQLLYTEPYFMVLLNKVSRGNQYKEELLYERIAEDYKLLETLEGQARKEKLHSIITYVTSVLLQEQPHAIQRTLEFITTVLTGDPAAIAPLVEVRQQALQVIESWKPEIIETYKQQDNQLKDKYGFDINFEKFADLTYFEAYQLFAVSLLAGQSKIASMKAMNAIGAFSHYKQGKLKEIAILEQQKKALFNRLKTLEKSAVTAQERGAIKSAIWKIEKRILGVSSSRLWGIGILRPAVPAWMAATAIDSAFIGFNYYKNKEYRLFARKILLQASVVGATSYASNIQSKNFDDKDLIYTVAIQAATAFTFTNFSFFRANNAGKLIHDFVHPKGATSFNMLIAAASRATWNGLVTAAKSPIVVSKGIAGLWKNLGTKSISDLVGDKVARPIINVIGTIIVATVVDMKLRGYSNPITMFQEDEAFRVNLFSFAIIDFLLSYVSEGNNATRSAMVNFFVSVVGIGITQYLVKGQDWHDFDVQRLLLEGAYISTYSTLKYKLFFKKSVIYFNNYWNSMFAHLARAGSGQTARSLTSASKFFINVGVFAAASNFAGNAPFLWIVRDLEKNQTEPEGRERYFADKMYEYILKVEQENPRIKYSPSDLEEYLQYLRQINEQLKRDIDSIQEVS